MTYCSDAVHLIDSMLIQRLSIQMSPIDRTSLLSRAQRSQVISSSLYDFGGTNHEGWSPQMTADPINGCLCLAVRYPYTVCRREK